MSVCTCASVRTRVFVYVWEAGFSRGEGGGGRGEGIVVRLGFGWKVEGGGGRGARNLKRKKIEGKISTVGKVFSAHHPGEWCVHLPLNHNSIIMHADLPDVLLCPIQPVSVKGGSEIAALKPAVNRSRSL